MTQSEAPHSETFTGGPRFELRNRLGEGAFGTVYEAFDRENNCVVALKHLRRVTADALYSFKQEFRSLTDLSHPNLVALYELLSDAGGNWLLVMELIDGVDFLTYQAAGAFVRIANPLSAGSGVGEPLIPYAPTMAATEQGGSAVQLPGIGPQSRQTSIGNATVGPIAVPVISAVAPTEGPLSVPAVLLTMAASPDPTQLETPELPAVQIQVAPARDFVVLRECLRQLAEGLCALHTAEKLHRDIKPSNILITKDGRVVLLDFGLVLDAFRPVDLVNSAARQVAAHQIVGTPAYMAPEQFVSGTVGPAADWYSVGVLLYEALTGQLPFAGDMWTLARIKQESEPAPVQLLRPDTPTDLATLCAQLLRRDPAQRPTGEQVQRWLDGKALSSTQGRTRRQPVALVERAPHFALLQDCYSAVQRGQTTVVLVQGQSGMGKSVLVHSYLQTLATRAEPPTVISGRCYEQESVPYKALDGVVDALSQHLRTLPEDRVAALLPADASPLAQLFPVLRQVPALRALPEPQALGIQGEEIRDRAFAALRTLLTRLAAAHSMVLLIDDVQWGDLDSATLLLELIRPPLPPRLLVLLCLRSDEVETSPTLRFLLPRLWTQAGEALSVRRLELTALSDGAARKLASELLGPHAEPASLLALESTAGRSPFFVTELARYLRDTAERPETREQSDVTTTADDLLWRRIERLRPAARRALECLALIGRPALRQLLRLSAELGHEELSALHELRAGHFIRTRRDDSATLFEPYHDRIRETVASRLPIAQRRQRHLSVATVMESNGFGDAEDLARHFHAAEQASKAALYVRAAARQATASLAFGRAAELLQNALDWGAESDAGELYAELGYARSAVGQGRAAAEAYLRAAELLTADRALDLRLRAADQLLRSGFLDVGMDLLKQDLQRIGVRLPADPRVSAVLGILRRTYVDLRGLAAKIRPESECSPATLHRLDTLQMVSVGFGMASVGRQIDVQSRYMLLALQTGEPIRLARALFLDAASWATQGVKAHARNQRYLDRAQEVLRYTADPRLEAYKYLSPGVVAYLEGRFFSAHDLLREAELRLRKCTGVAWELEIGTRYLLLSGLMLGELEVLLARSEPLLRDAQRRDDAYSESTLRPTVLYMAELLRDDPVAALAHVTAAQARWINRGFHAQHYWAETARLDVLLYSEKWSEAEAHLRRPWLRDTQRYMMPYHEFARIMTLHRCGRACLAGASVAAVQSSARRRLLTEVEALVQSLLREQATWATALAWHLRGGQLALAGDHATALSWMTCAKKLCADVGLRLYAYSLDYRSGQLLGGQEGEARCQQAVRELSNRGTQAPEKLLAMLLPLRL